MLDLLPLSYLSARTRGAAQDGEDEARGRSRASGVQWPASAWLRSLTETLPASWTLEACQIVQPPARVFKSGAAARIRGRWHGCVSRLGMSDGRPHAGATAARQANLGRKAPRMMVCFGSGWKGCLRLIYVRALRTHVGGDTRLGLSPSHSSGGATSRRAAFAPGSGPAWPKARALLRAGHQKCGVITPRPKPAASLSPSPHTTTHSNTMSGPAVKIQHGEIVRKVTLPSSLEWAGVSSLVRDRFQLGEEARFVLTYKDQDGDLIAVVSNGRDWIGCGVVWVVGWGQIWVRHSGGRLIISCQD